MTPEINCVKCGKPVEHPDHDHSTDRIVVAPYPGPGYYCDECLARVLRAYDTISHLNRLDPVHLDNLVYRPSRKAPTIDHVPAPAKEENGVAYHPPQDDPVDHPAHYTQGGIETIQVIEAWGLGYNLGNAVKYISRAGKKDPEKTVEDLKKARWYLDREIKRREGE